MGVVEAALAALGFQCSAAEIRRDRESVSRGWATRRPHFCFAGHTDVVPPGDAAPWRHDPFAGEVAGGTLYGRGAADMKGGDRRLRRRRRAQAAPPDGNPRARSRLLITGDEEGDADRRHRESAGVDEGAKANCIDHCLVGEPTSAAQSGDMIKIGRRGSMTRARAREWHAGACRLSAPRAQSHSGAGRVRAPAHRF